MTDFTDDFSCYAFGFIFIIFALLSFLLSFIDAISSRIFASS